jgi:hypothetical protein
MNTNRLFKNMKHHEIKTDTTPIYHDFEDGRFFINSPSCIISSDQIVQIGAIYLFSDLKESGTKLLLVKLLNVRFDEASMYLHLLDILSGKIFKVKQIVRPESEKCSWMLVDMQFFNEKLRKKKADHNESADTLLEFDF